MSTPQEPPSNLYSLPPKKPRYTAEDHEDLSDARRLVTLRGSVKHLAGMRGDLHRIFGDVVRVDAAWPFFSVRQLQNYVEKPDFDLLTHSPEVLDAARTMAQIEVAANIATLSKALLTQTGLSLAGMSGADLREDHRLLRLKESELALAKDILAGATPSEQDTLKRATDLTHHGLRFMYNLSTPLSQTGKKVITNLAAGAPDLSAHETDPDYVTPRRRHLRMAEHWLRVSNGELQLMKLNLLADYVDQSRQKRSEQASYEGFLMAVTVPQRNFIEGDAKSHRDLAKADETLHLALTH